MAMPPLYRIDIAKEVYYALDEAEKDGHLERIKAEKKRGKINVQRFKGLGEMNPMQLRETTMAADTRRLIQLTLDDLPKPCRTWICCWPKSAAVTVRHGWRLRGIWWRFPDPGFLIKGLVTNQIFCEFYRQVYGIIPAPFSGLFY